MRNGDHHPTLDLRQIDSLQVYRGSLPCNRPAGHIAMDLKAAHFGDQPARNQFDFLILLYFAGGQRSRYNGAETADAERPVDGQPKHADWTGAAELPRPGRGWLFSADPSPRRFSS